MRLQHLALFRGIGLGACAVNLGSRMPSTRPAPDRLWRLHFGHHRLAVDSCAEFPPSFSQRRSAAESPSPFCELAKVWQTMTAINEAAQRPLS